MGRMRRMWPLVCLLVACGGSDAGSDGDDAGGTSQDLGGFAGEGGAPACGGGGGSGGLAVSTQPLQPGTSTLTLTAAGQQRSILLHVPSGTQPLPLVIALHGNGDTNSNFVAALNLATLSDQDGFVLAAPQGISQ